jgi:hypothetical protein
VRQRLVAQAELLPPGEGVVGAGQEARGVTARLRRRVAGVGAPVGAVRVDAAGAVPARRQAS